MSERQESERAAETGSRETRECPSCGATVGGSVGTYPFCSARCRDVDLGKWFKGEYMISRDIKDSDLDTVD